MAEDMGEKTEPASPKKRDDARKKGSIAKSADLNAAIAITAAAGVIVLMLPGMMRDLGEFMRLMLGELRVGESGATEARIWLWQGLVLLGKAAGPVLLVALAGAYFGGLVQVGWLVTGEPLMPDLSKLNPTRGVQQLLSPMTAAKTAATLLKLFFLGLTVWILVRRNHEQILGLTRLEWSEALIFAGGFLKELLTWFLACLILIGIADYAFQRWNWERQHRMSHEEVKEEFRTMQGDPKVRGRQRSFARKILMQRINTAVPKADVIVTNPEHLAIALKWDPETMNAPKVLAKGADFMALRIRQVAALHNVPIVEKRELARAMYPLVKVGQEVPSRFYTAVAEVLAYVYRLTGRKVA